MKEKISPLAAIITIVIILCVAGFFIVRAGSPAANGPGEKPPGMPADAAAEFQKRMGTSSPTGATTGGSSTTTPSSTYIAPPPSTSH